MSFQNPVYYIECECVYDRYLIVLLQEFASDSHDSPTQAASKRPRQVLTRVSYSSSLLYRIICSLIELLTSNVG